MFYQCCHRHVLAARGPFSCERYRKPNHDLVCDNALISGKRNKRKTAVREVDWPVCIMLVGIDCGDWEPLVSQSSIRRRPYPICNLVM